MNQRHQTPVTPGMLDRRGSDTSYVVSRWPFLPPHIREAVVTLVDAGLALADRPRIDSEDEQYERADQ